MDENRVAGTARNLGGKVQEGLGRAIGDEETVVSGIANQVAGSAQDLYGRARDSAADAATAAREGASSLQDTVRNFIESQPYTAAGIAVAIGWFLGRMHRPL
jgi:uncharacterized protein YjbJ (UPF0337 family)